MKKSFFVLLLLVLVPTVRAGSDDVAQLAVALAQVGIETYVANEEHKQSLPNEKNFRKRIYWLSEHNPYFYKLDSFQKDFDYYIAVLGEHIKTLEGKITLKKNGLTSSAMRKAGVASVLSTLSGFATCYFLLLRNEIMQGSYHDAMRRGLQQSKTGDLMLTSVMFGLVSGCFAALAGSKLHKALRYNERLLERLERDKTLLAVLEREKVEFDNKKANNDFVVNAAVSDIVNAIVVGLNNVLSGVPKPAATE